MPPAITCHCCTINSVKALKEKTTQKSQKSTREIASLITIKDEEIKTSSEFKTEKRFEKNHSLSNTIILNASSDSLLDIKTTAVGL